MRPHSYERPLLMCVVLLLRAFTTYASCDLQCINNGECRTAADNRQYCHCPTGFTGSNCQIVFVVCENANSTCYSGERCIRDLDNDNKEFFRCECDPKNSILTDASAGSFCEHAAVTVCGQGPDKHSDPTKSGSSHYCANSGRCVPFNQGYKCNCVPGWTGYRCEDSSYQKVNTGERPRTKEHGSLYNQMVRVFKIIAATLMFTVILIFLACLALLVNHGTAGRRRPRVPRTSSRRQRQRVPVVDYDEKEDDETGQELTPIRKGQSRAV